MNTSAEKRALVKTTIQSAFADTVLGKGISIRQSEVVDRYGEGVTDKEFEELPLQEVTDDWSRISDEELDRSCVSHFDPEGYRYYIPALMLSVMRNYKTSSMRVIGTISSLHPKKPYWYYDTQRYELLNHEQKFAIALYLSHLPELVPLEFEDPILVSDALQNYWQQFMSPADRISAA